MTWLVSASQLEGSVTVATTGADNPLVAGNLVSILVPTIICLVFNHLRPSKFDFAITRAIGETSSNYDSSSNSQGSQTPENEKASLGSPVDEKSMPMDHSIPVSEALEKTKTVGTGQILKLESSFKFARNSALGLTFILIILVPCMAGE